MVAWIWVVAERYRDMDGSHLSAWRKDSGSLQAHDMGTAHSGALSGKWQDLGESRVVGLAWDKPEGFLRRAKVFEGHFLQLSR